jgi:transcription antitermination factor NusG
MPALALEQSQFPDNLLDGFASQEGDRRWWAVYTKARQEKAITRQMIAQEIPCYLPLVEKNQVVRGRRTCSFQPVFGGYVFLFGDDDERVKVLQTNRVSQMLPVYDADELCNDLRQVRTLIDSKAPLTVESRLEAGQAVRIKTGPFAGLEGTILQRRNSSRLLIAVNYLQQGVSIQIDDFLVEPI